MRASKLSEYKFLQILKGFAEDKTARELASEIRISEKTIRATYRALRLKLIEALVRNRSAFGGAGSYLLRHGRFDARTRRFLEGVAASDLFSKHVERHAPRLRSKEDAQGLLFEVAMRMFCSLSMREGTLIDYPPDTKQALIEMREIGLWIRQNLEREGFLDKYGHVVERFRKLTGDMKLLTEKEELLALKSKSRMHAYTSDRFYNDMRRYLLKSPLGLS